MDNSDITCTCRGTGTGIRFRRKIVTGPIAASVVLLLLSGGCEKEPAGTPSCNGAQYYPLKTGNYWIYRNYKIYSDGNIDENDNDSLYISSDTLMLGTRYYHLQGNFHRKPVNYFLTCNNTRIISADNYIFYKSPDLSDTLKLYPFMGYDFPATIKTTLLDSQVTVPAGKFNPVMLLEAHSVLDDNTLVVIYKACFAKNVGLVKFTSKPRPFTDYESFTELVRYHADF